MKEVPVYGIIEFSEENQEAYFYSCNLRVHLDNHHFINSPHKHSTYIAILFTHGIGEHYVDFQTYYVKPGSVFLLNPGQVHSWKLSEDANGYVLFHTKEFYNRIFLNRKIEDYPFFYLQGNHPEIYLKPHESEIIEPLFKLINEEYHSHLPYKNNKLGSLTDLLYIELSRIYNEKDNMPASNSNYLKLRKLQKLIDDHFKTKKFPNEYADLMNMSVRHLNRICRESLNKSTGRLITERILLEAQRMLVHNDASISSIADQLGYQDYSYFIRLFKKETGESPKNFQNRMMKP